jgi:hypothetical protein
MAGTVSAFGSYGQINQERMMKIRTQLIAASMLGLMGALPTLGVADQPVPQRPAKAAPTATLTKPLEMKTVVKPPVAPAQTLQPRKPPVATAVAPKLPAAPTGKRSIIFVGGKPGDGKAALNPQPIPPGHGGPGDPIR